MAYDYNAGKITKENKEMLVMILRNMADIVEGDIHIEKGHLISRSHTEGGFLNGYQDLGIEMTIFEDPRKVPSEVGVALMKPRTDETDAIICTLDKQLVKRKARELEQIQKRYKLIEDAMKEPNDDYNKAWRVQYILDGKMDAEG